MPNTVLFDSSNAFGMDCKSDVIKVIFATSIAISEPLPIAILTLACANACESLIPSPTIATIFPSVCNFSTKAALSEGITSP